MSDKVSPRPWKLKINEDEEYWIEDANEIWMFNAFYDENVEHFLKCVNEHESLVAEVERLKEILQKPKIDEFSYNKIQEENKQLREALLMFNPYARISLNSGEHCRFCGASIEMTHFEDCEYIRLTEAKE